MKLRPSKLKPGDKILYDCGFGPRVAYFVKRIPRRYGCPATNYLRFPDFVGTNGPDDDGICVASDYNLCRDGRLANEVAA